MVNELGSPVSLGICCSWVNRREIIFSSFLPLKTFSKAVRKMLHHGVNERYPDSLSCSRAEGHTWSKCCLGRRLVAEVLRKRACLGVLLPFRIWRHLARLTWGKLCKVGVCGSACLEREQWCQEPLDMVCSSAFKCPSPARMAGARTRHSMGDDSLGGREQSQLRGQEIPPKSPWCS